MDVHFGSVHHARRSFEQPNVPLPIFDVSLRKDSEKEGLDLPNECLLPKTCFDSKHTAELNKKSEVGGQCGHV